VEREWWIAVSVLAGVGEEITWRGVQAALASVLTGGFWAAALVCSISFGLTHIVQGWKSSAIIFVFALGFHALVWLGESLYVAMAVHVAYDITAGVGYGRLGRELVPMHLDSAPVGQNWYQLQSNEPSDRGAGDPRRFSHETAASYLP
jgi:membrane protease YdiL (CAAX protease family)